MKTVYINVKDKMTERKMKKIAKKLYKINKKEEIVVALSKELMKNKELNDKIEEYGVKILDGKWLFKFLLYDIIEYISKVQNKEKELLNVAILMQNQDDIIMSQIPDIAKDIKALKIITEKITNLEYIEEKLYIDYGIALYITNNKMKSLTNADIILNFDYNEENLSKYKINPLAILVNLQWNIEGNTCINISGYEIEYDKNNFLAVDNENDFDKNVIYESYIYRKDTFSNIRKQLTQDKTRLIGLRQNNGKIYMKKSLDKQKILA